MTAAIFITYRQNKYKLNLKTLNTTKTSHQFVENRSDVSFVSASRLVHSIHILMLTSCVFCTMGKSSACYLCEGAAVGAYRPPQDD